MRAGRQKSARCVVGATSAVFPAGAGRMGVSADRQYRDRDRKWFRETIRVSSWRGVQCCSLERFGILGTTGLGGRQATGGTCASQRNFPAYVRCGSMLLKKSQIT